MNATEAMVLVVETDADARGDLVRRLNRAGLHTDAAATTDEALARIEAQRPDLLMLGHDKSGGSGLQMLADVRQRFAASDLPVILMTYSDSTLDVVKALHLGANDFLAKPLNGAIMLARVRVQLQLREAMAALEQANRRLEEMVLVDCLTGVPNRRHFDLTLDREARRSLRDPAPLSVVLADVDHFKSFNDLYGHEAGDRVLQQVARAMNDVVRRAADFFARYGGEEFVAVLPGTDSAGAVVVAERMREAVAALAIPHEGAAETGLVTMSLGVSTVVPADGLEPKQLIAMADTRLYRAKRGGRNQVVGTGQVSGVFER